VSQFRLASFPGFSWQLKSASFGFWTAVGPRSEKLPQPEGFARGISAWPSANRGRRIGGPGVCSHNPCKGGKKMARCYLLPTRHEWDQRYWRTPRGRGLRDVAQSQRGWGKFFMPIEIALFGPSAKGRPAPTFVKLGVIACPSWAGWPFYFDAL